MYLPPLSRTQSKYSVTEIYLFSISFSPSQALNIYESISREFESALLWISNGIEFTTYPTAYFSKQPSGENGMSEDMKRDTFALQTVIGDGVNETMNFFQKVISLSSQLKFSLTLLHL